MKKVGIRETTMDAGRILTRRYVRRSILFEEGNKTHEQETRPPNLVV